MVFFVERKCYIFVFFFCMRMHILACYLCVEETFSKMFNPDTNSVSEFNFIPPHVDLTNKT